MNNFIDTIIIGAGPAGIQLGYFFNKINQEYIILEQNNIPGSFFSKYPHSKELISINKIHTGKTNKEFNLRHDWNSLLNDFDVEMKDFSSDYYPSREDFVKYLSTFALKHKIHIEYNTTIKHITKQNNIFVISSNNNTWTCNKLIIATGLSKPNIPKNIENYSSHYSEFPKDYFLDEKNLNIYKNKKVLIFGLGNSAFELANILTPYCASVVVFGRNHTPTPSFSTHYVGDLRSKYLSFYDTFLLKSLNAFETTQKTNRLIIEKHNNLFYLKIKCESDCQCLDSFYREPNIGFHYIINCTGWGFDNSIFDDSIKPNMFNSKYPEINSNYESTNVNNMFFIGSLMHSYDYRKSSGGFIHGFRYLIDNFVKINYTNFTPHVLENITSLANMYYKRINISSSLYQMHGQLCDLFYLQDDKFIYYEHIPISYLFTKTNIKIKLPPTYLFILTLEYGPIESDLKRIGGQTTSIGQEDKAVLLHPILRVYNNKENTLGQDDIFYPNYTSLSNQKELVNLYHFDEDLLVNFTNKQTYLEKFFRIIKGYF